MKRFFTSLVLLCSACFFNYAERYQIRNVNYDISGITRPYALKRAVEIDKKTVFESYEELSAYVDNLRQLFNNQRNLASSIVNVKYDSFADEEGITGITLNIITIDSKHFLFVPYPKYNSNDGFILKLKAKDTNFLGTMETLNFDLNFSVEPQDDTSDEYDTKFGINLQYDYPFKIWRLDSKWKNNFSISYTIGETKPEFSYKTGFVFELPFDNISLKLDLTQGIARNFDYTEYDDELYFTEGAKLSMPYKAGKIENFDDVRFSPYISYDWYWDKNGISSSNGDLSSPVLRVGYTVDTGRINWTENFRNGVTMNMDQHVGYNYQNENYLASVSGNLALYKAFKYAGIYSRFIGFYNFNSTTSIGSYLRGIRDDQHYSQKAWEKAGYTGEAPKALNTSAAIVGNIDIPIHIVTTDWLAFDAFLFGESSWLTNHLRWMRYFDFELQIAPFVDFAFCNNEVTGKTFAIKDGFYSGGLEVLVYPAKWRSLVVRASCGIDAGRKIVKKVVSKLIDDSWRREVSAIELSIGIGLHY